MIIDESLAMIHLNSDVCQLLFAVFQPVRRCRQCQHRSQENSSELEDRRLAETATVDECGSCRSAAATRIAPVHMCIIGSACHAWIEAIGFANGRQMSISPNKPEISKQFKTLACRKVIFN